MALNYAADAIFRTVDALGYDEVSPEDEPLVLMYSLLTLVLGENVTQKAVHDAWALWKVRINPRHPSIVPFGDLTPAVQELDEPYVQGIRRAAAVLEAAQ